MIFGSNDRKLLVDQTKVVLDGVESSLRIEDLLTELVQQTKATNRIQLAALGYKDYLYDPKDSEIFHPEIREAMGFGVTALAQDRLRALFEGGTPNDFETEARAVPTPIEEPLPVSASVDRVAFDVTDTTAVALVLPDESVLTSVVEDDTYEPEFGPDDDKPFTDLGFDPDEVALGGVQEEGVR